MLRGAGAGLGRRAAVAGRSAIGLSGYFLSVDEDANLTLDGGCCCRRRRRGRCRFVTAAGFAGAGFALANGIAGACGGGCLRFRGGRRGRLGFGGRGSCRVRNRIQANGIDGGGKLADSAAADELRRYVRGQLMAVDENAFPLDGNSALRGLRSRC